MSRFEVFALMVMVAVVIGLGVGGVALLIGMAVEVYAPSIRRLKAMARRGWKRCFMWREGAATPDDVSSDPQHG